MPKKEQQILKQCPCHRDSEEPAGGETGYCSLDEEKQCSGEVQFCENPQALKEYLLDRGLGWQEKKRKNRFKQLLQIIDRLIKSTFFFLTPK
jgi:hypothetical protein